MSNYTQVQEFHKAFSIPMPSTPTKIPLPDLINRMDFLTEEVVESLHAVSDTKDEFVKAYTELTVRMNAAFAKQYSKPFPKDKLTGLVDSLADIDYINKGTWTLINVDPKEPFNIVHNANMGKLHDGAPKYNEYGKIIKPDDWEDKFAPEALLKQEIERQIEEAENKKESR